MFHKNRFLIGRGDRYQWWWNYEMFNPVILFKTDLWGRFLVIISCIILFLFIYKYLVHPSYKHAELAKSCINSSLYSLAAYPVLSMSFFAFCLSSVLRLLSGRSKDCRYFEPIFIALRKDDFRYPQLWLQQTWSLERPANFPRRARANILGGKLSFAFWVRL